MKSIGELYFDNKFFSDEASKTIGQPLLGPDMMTIFENRRGAKGKLTSEGRNALDYIVSNISRVLGVKVKAVWDRHCGCSMCPCSPGYRIKADIPFSSKEDTRFNMWVQKDGTFDYRLPKTNYELGYTTHKELESTFNK